MEEEGHGKGKGRVSPDELEDLQAKFLRLSSSFGEQWVARSRANGKVRQWDAKEVDLYRAGEEERAD